MISWTAPNLAFICLSALVLSSAAVAAFSKSIVRAAFSLFFTLAGMAGYYVLLGSDFVAVTQVIIYVGGILVLLMFGVLLTNRSDPESAAAKRSLSGAVLAVLFFGVILAPVITLSPWAPAANLQVPAANTAELGKLLVGDYMLVFLLSGMTLLLCLVGAAFLVRRRDYD